MTQEEKQLLLKELCVRLPYGVRISLTEPERDASASEFSYRDGRFLTGILYAVYPQENRVIIDELSEPIAQYNVRCGGFDIDECNVRPYLRSMSSMTDKEREEWADLFNLELDKLNEIDDEDKAEELAPYYFGKSHQVSIDWLNAHHFDYRGLIPKGLALEAPEGMYKAE